MRDFVQLVRAYYRRPAEAIHLIETPIFGNEYKYIKECLDSKRVSTSGTLTDTFEQKIVHYSGSAYAVATVSGTSALHLALLATGVQPGDWVITQPFTYVATANAIRYVGAHPLFVDIDGDTLGLSPHILLDFLKEWADINDQGKCIHRPTQRRIAACLPVHTFGHPARIDAIVSVSNRYGIPVIEDAAEGLGSRYQNQQVGTFGKAGVFSFNGNKIVTSGGGGAVVTDDAEVAARVQHLATQAKVTDHFRYTYDAVGYNYRMPSLNAALGIAQWENIDQILTEKRRLAEAYRSFFQDSEETLITSPEGTASNYWLNALLFDDIAERDDFLQYTNQQQVYTRAAWTLLHRLPMFASECHGPVPQAEKIEKRLVNLPSSIRHEK